MTGERKYLLFIILLHAVFFFFALSQGTTILPDSIDYLSQAENIEDEGSFYSGLPDLQPKKIDYYSKRPPLYGLVVWALFKITLSNKGDIYFSEAGYYTVLLLQNILSIITCWWVFKILKNYLGVRKPGLWAGLAFLLFPSVLLYANLVMSEALLMFLITGAFYCFLKYLQDKKFKWVVLNNILLALALLTKPVMLYFWVVNAVILLIFAIKNRQYYLPLPVLLLPLIAMLWSEKNYRETGYRHYSSITHVNLKDYNTKYYLFSRYGAEYGDSVIAAIDAKAERIEDYAQSCEYIKDTCKHIILHDIPGYGKAHIKGMFTFMADPGRYDYANFFHIKQEDPLGLLHYVSKGNWQEIKQYLKTQPLGLIILLVLVMIGSGLVFLLCLVYLFARNTPLWPKIYLAVMVGYIWFLTGPIGTARFRVPIYPLMVVAAVAGLDALKQRKQKPESPKF